MLCLALLLGLFAAFPAAGLTSEAFAADGSFTTSSDGEPSQGSSGTGPSVTDAIPPGADMIVCYHYDPNAIRISSAEDLKQLAQQPDKNFILANDIDLAGADWEPIAFSGILYGDGHTIYNLKVTRFGKETAHTVDGNDKVYDSLAAGLFSVLDGAQIYDLGIRGADIEVRGEQHCFAGVLAGCVNSCLIDGCSIQDARVTLTAACSPEPDNNRKSCNAGVGGIAGFGSADISSCDVSATLVFIDECDRSLKVEEFLGGVISNGYGNITDCTVEIDGYASCRGYAHNGGLVGMYYVYDKSRTQEECIVSDDTVSGTITFFEDNRDRRAYCDPYVGEKMTWPKFSNLKHSFRNGETKNYSATLGPEKCGQPQITDVVTPGNCEDWGYTTHTCGVCGHTWKDSFTPKVHDPGDWETTVQVGSGSDGLKVRRCRKCGEIAEQQVVKAIQSLSLDSDVLELNYKDTGHVTAHIEPQDAEGPGLRWTSTDEKVATVNNNGYVTATGRGEAKICCTTEDGVLYAVRDVKVDYSTKQWLIKIFLFGWIWY